MAWYVCPYIWITDWTGGLMRYCAMSDYTEQLRLDAGRTAQPVELHGAYPSGEKPLWAEAEMLGDRAIVKVHTAASSTVLAVLDAVAIFYRIPAEILDIILDDQGVTNQDLNAMWAIMRDAGYTAAELRAALGVSNISQLRGKKLREYFNRAALLRWRRPSGVEGEFETTDWPSGAPTTIEAVDDRIA